MNEAITGRADVGDFDLGSDVKPEPLIPQGKYTGSITKTKLSDDSSRMLVMVALNNNEGLMSDGETPIDGQVITYFVYFPMEADKARVSKTGKSTYQWKINNLSKVAKSLGLHQANTFADFQQVVQEAKLVGQDVVASISIEPHYQTGVPENRVASIAVTE